MNIYLIGVLVFSIILAKFYQWWQKAAKKKLSRFGYISTISILSIIWPFTFGYAVWFLFIRKGN
jgi:hypothetical protein